MPIDTTLPWWLGPRKEPWEALLSGVQAGTAIRSNNLRAQQMIMESEQNVRREEVATAIKMMDMGFEKDRNDLALRSFQAKQEADKMKVEAMLEMGTTIGTDIKEGKTADKSAQANFWNKAAQWMPFVGYEAVNSMFDNTYGAATKAEQRARGIDGDAKHAPGENLSILKGIDLEIAKLENEASNPVSEEHAADAKARLNKAKEYRDVFTSMAGVAKQGQPQIEVFTGPGGESFKAFVTYDRGGRKQYKRIPEVDASKLSQVESVLLKKEAQAIDPESIRYFKKDKDGKFAFDEEQYKDDLKALEEKYTKKKPAAPGAAPASAVTPPASDPLDLFK
jgi:hypothetical protein